MSLTEIVVDGTLTPDDRLTASTEVCGPEGLRLPSVDDDGDLLSQFGPFLRDGCHLAVMPMPRINVEYEPIAYRGVVAFYPPGTADLSLIKIVENDEHSTSLAEACSAFSGITGRVLDQSNLVVFPCRFEWEAYRRSSHRGQIELLRQLSESVDRLCLNFVRYRLCTLDLVETLPGRAGQVGGNPMMAGACLYNHSVREARIVGGAAFTHLITQGLGLNLETIATDDFPRLGEVGHIVEHALGLYSAAQEASSLTAKFMQAISLLEYLAFPGEYRALKKVRSVVVRYAAGTATRHEQLTERFKNELFGPNGYRTDIVHKGKRLEQLLPAANERRELFRELDGYIRCMLDDMVQHSELNWAEHLENRTKIGVPGHRGDE